MVCGQHYQRRKSPSSSVETSNPTKQVIDQPPIVRITGQRRPVRGTIGRSGANRDYRMSTYDDAVAAACRNQRKD
jgi:hypothetical protein